ncbi:TetR/AcrR family transcriptional regulator [Curtobacterium sp. ISL-83]|uniref:TetR/AcrR family transcriptional regulator n=1 Tax=Curtobacterium sp. ISL-83 TaxID=2819145 RepID=UPI001BE791FE|nr:TetR family transcriptional regulator [Curtobacterium sp. ISL-83]MBT2503453.1 TetR family transcriptional regulator [Curtobacterium sp. ISL-83]
MSQSIPDGETLRERKRRLVQQRIIDAADELFAAKGYDDVSVTDIAARADVGRTTFFRYFGDKAEVVFAHEEEMLDRITRVAADEPVGAAGTAAEAVAQLRTIVVALCDHAAADIAGYALHYELVDKHPELRAHDAFKTQLIAERFTMLLVERGTTASTAVFASQVALACYQTARRRATSPEHLGAETRAAFDELASL